MAVVFLNRDYDVATPRPMLFVDIGMNVGLASLAMAARPDVQIVHGYEPFTEPYSRALTHFALNPALAGKIVANHIALGDTDETREVRLEGPHTIGTSVRGHSVGRPETITVRNAAPIIAALAEQARAEELDLVLKVDCEGSEFAIFETLGRAGLFQAVTALVVEWHKWWSPDRTQAELILPLREAGFVVMDRTLAANPHAGVFYAARTGAAP